MADDTFDPRLLQAAQVVELYKTSKVYQPINPAEYDRKREKIGLQLRPFKARGPQEAKRPARFLSGLARHLITGQKLGHERHTVIAELVR